MSVSCKKRNWQNITIWKVGYTYRVMRLYTTLSSFSGSMNLEPELTAKAASSPFKYASILVAQRLKRLPPMRETWVRSLGQEDPLEKEMATHSSILAWRIPWMEEPGRLQSMGSQRVGHDWATSPQLTSPHLYPHAPNPCQSWEEQCLSPSVKWGWGWEARGKEKSLPLFWESKWRQFIKREEPIKRRMM